MAKKTSFLLELGGSDKGPMGLCIRAMLEAGATRQDALAHFKHMFEEGLSGFNIRGQLDYHRATEYVTLYINPDRITIDHVTEAEDEDEDDS